MGQEHTDAGDTLVPAAAACGARGSQAAEDRESWRTERVAAGHREEEEAAADPAAESWEVAPNLLQCLTEE